MKYFNILALCLSFILFINCKTEKKEKEEKWISLFNGKDLSGWTPKINGYELGDNVMNTFIVEDGVMKVSYDNYENFTDQFGHIFYEKPFSNYILKLEYRFVGEQAPGGQSWATKNSGVMVHSQSAESMGLNQAFPVSIEVQFLGGVKEGEPRPTGNLCTPGMHVILADTLTKKHCIPSNSETYYGEEWVELELEVYNDSLLRHNINGKEVISYSKPIIGGEYNVFPERDGEKVTSGYISLQSESHPIEFRNIKLLDLDDR